MILLGIIAIGLAAASPFLAAMVAMKVSEGIVAISQKKLDQIEADQPFTEIPIFKQNLSIQFPPDYQRVEKYDLSFNEGNLNFGNGYTLQLNDFSSIENHLNENTLIATKNYDPVNNLLMVKNSITQFPIVNDGKKHIYDKANGFETERVTAVRVTGNLLESVTMQKMKESGSFLTLYQQNNIGDVKTGIVINASPSSGLSDELGEISQSYVILTKYWLFPDGVGVFVDVNDLYLGKLVDEDDFDHLTEKKLAEIDRFTNNTYTWLSEHFEMKITD
ncbi:hypothetical protein [Candidatus Enterococcus ferrettii]|uniref:ABC transporter permease n=1 Tax=Candidatus Enterococcus ferrettii TaxID=2815324 RepID=A0ABV0EK73_9ENTE|nr:hypothetical protein [Enterococcus sp. 665A]MBO1341372.1 hypothetical protein [Enterococcus sp. 665A]